MKKQDIRLGTLDGAKEFVKAANKCDFDIDVYFNRIALDAKSILGILSIDPRNKISVQYDGQNDGFNSVLAKYAV